MNTRLPPEYAGELFFKADVENMPYPILPPEGAVDLLTKACTMLGQVRFDWAYIDRPKEGSVYVVMLGGDDVPHDGYQYMDDEVTYNFTSETGKRMIIQERQQGFIPGDQFTHIARRRYKLVNIGKDNVVLLHYTRADDTRKVVVDPRMAKTVPRSYPLKPLPSAAGAPGQPMAYQQQQSGMPGYRPPFPAQQQPQPQVPQQMKSPAGINAAKSGSPYGASPVAPGSPGAAATGQQAGYGRFQAGVPTQVPGQPIQQPPQPTGAPQRLASINGGRKQSHKKQANPQATLQAQLQHQQLLAQQQEDAEEPSGDELDFLTTRDVAIARYKRNHDYMAEVFSPYPATAIIPNQYDYQQSIEFFKTLQAKHGDDLDELKQSHDDKIKRFKAEAEVFYRGMLELKQATTVQEVVTANERVESFVGTKVLPYSFLRRTELPPDEASKTPELRAKLVPVVPVPAVPVLEVDPAPVVANGSEASQAATAEGAVSLPPAATTGATEAAPADNAVSAENVAPADNTEPAASTMGALATLAAESPLASLAQAEPAVITTTTTTTTTTDATVAPESSAMDVDSKPQDGNEGTISGLDSSSDMQVDGAPSPASVLSTGASEAAATPVPPPVAVDAVQASEPSSVITHDEDHVMTEAPALGTEPEAEPIDAPVLAPTLAPPAPASAPAPVPATDSVSSISPAAPEPTPTPVSLPAPDANEVVSNVSTPTATPTPVVIAESTTVAEPTVVEAVGHQAEGLPNPSSAESVSNTASQAPSGEEAKATSPTAKDFPTSGFETAPVPEEVGQAGIEEAHMPVVDPTPVSAAVQTATPSPVSEPTPAVASVEADGGGVSMVLESEPSPAVEESTGSLPSSTDLAAAGSNDFVAEEAAQSAEVSAAAAAAANTVVDAASEPAATLVMEKTVGVATAEAVPEATVATTTTTSAETEAVVAGDDPAHH
ncbi:hypothetical protein DFQ26_002375 [Actinomortierella ambigua]|nr:hypothetical protein DFQ26_002375 [Actinomortierella ambigua]